MPVNMRGCGFHSANFYQIFTCVKNKDIDIGDGERSVSGMLLYAKTEEELQPEGARQRQQHITPDPQARSRLLETVKARRIRLFTGIEAHLPESTLYQRIRTGKVGQRLCVAYVHWPAGGLRRWFFGLISSERSF